MAEKLCKNCGESFMADHHAKLYCSDKCKAVGKAPKLKPEADAPTKVSTAVLPVSDPGKTGPLESSNQTIDPGKLEGVGVAALTTMTDAPVEVDRRGDMIIMESRQTPVTTLREQPLLSEEAATKLGTLTWHRYNLDKHIFTCVVNGRRLMLTEATFKNMKAQGKALQDG